ncbi:hypothetical protein [Sphingomonas sp. Leaf25]|uniref:hypothetical protein n=1 Tax=Sphingomonas sp. Leaf25 TaxID=1735692 RepID=UPI0006F20D4F|nr:hypothetical protein [Sphingomonas sp. Leaf25]KQM98751.1 hypothetical protein ASE78_05860 [Sphingomonas sp. Leaf25]
MANTKQRAAFLAALTATDQMPPAERQRLAEDARRSAKSKAKIERYSLWMGARAAYHDAAAAELRAMMARAIDMPERHALQTTHDAACRTMLAAFARFMASPLMGKSDAKERRVMIRAARGVIALSTSRDAFLAATVEWMAHVKADAARIGGKA